MNRCGNGNVDLEEQCDDGNTRSNDGCSATCTLEIQLVAGEFFDPLAAAQKLSASQSSTPQRNFNSQVFGSQQQLQQKFGLSQQLAYQQQSLLGSQFVQPQLPVQGMGIAQFPSFQPQPYNVPFTASLQRRTTSYVPISQTGPAALFAVAGGAAAGIGLVRRKKKR
ncbi:MAG: myxococcus cysteine-rich repeat containing protein [bacterium]|nr:myxococcus cysteine-rich repeat containing protein [bacterium]